ncbi:hypothetical protein M199_gp200 [Halogranum tailed virus 1]|uniref:Uncharacterized protein n=1 Tax=Halogranum tailed virus 1 TaxID=1273749 RepID=R4TGT1_9CAUD|nr:hypothetical protein M199_gp200 [Halogranum tailed virus 1]AGM11466.1 hypothetical protein HGTV1_169 [Halogranum tailed virus 1]
MALSDLDGQGWVRAEPPRLDDEETVVAVVDGEPVKAGFERKESPVEDSPSRIHRVFRSGRYDLEVRLETTSDMAMEGFVRVERADGY